MLNKESTPYLGKKSVLAEAMSSALPENTSSCFGSVPSLIAPDETTAAQASVSPTETIEEPEAKIEMWAAKINTAHAKGVSAIIEIGTQLSQAKEALGHGNFTKMIKTKIQFGARQAEKYKRIAEHPTLANPNYSSFLPGSVALLNLLASVKDKNLVLTAVQQVQARINAGDKVDLHDRAFWIGLIPALDQPAKQEQPTATTSTETTSDSVPPTAPDDGGSSTQVTNEPEADATTATATGSAQASASAVTGTEQTAVMHRPDTDQAEPTALGTEERQDPPAAEHTEAIAPTTEDANTPTDQADLAKHGIVRLPSPTQALEELADLRSRGLDSTNLSEKEKQQGDALYHLWEETMKPKWHEYPKAVRIILLETLLKEELKDENRKEAA
ncbi:DUF3102 domain-containing protein [Thiocapsa marina]|uniref:Uncharacterized protein n=1 Tax=Thiocapsa marina 5811 TaxID=768671 RepID=F9UH34_9GAMM|nr:DUF3102 domain-containing protein [Thiocapsa marina]EGV16438.1 hypothetical protein ThimaDRAFT_4207 [Thiocapsa marina 5811]